MKLASNSGTDLRVSENRDCIHTLRGHTSTVRCLRVIDGRPIAVSGSRDATLIVWNIETGTALHHLVGHEASVRCMDVSGNKVVSGSYDATCRVSPHSFATFDDELLIFVLVRDSFGISIPANAFMFTGDTNIRSMLLRSMEFGS